MALAWGGGLANHERVRSSRVSFMVRWCVDACVLRVRVVFNDACGNWEKGRFKFGLGGRVVLFGHLLPMSTSARGAFCLLAG